MSDAPATPTSAPRAYGRRTSNGGSGANFRNGNSRGFSFSGAANSLGFGSTDAHRNQKSRPPLTSDPNCRWADVGASFKKYNSRDPEGRSSLKAPPPAENLDRRFFVSLGVLLAIYSIYKMALEAMPHINEANITEFSIYAQNQLQAAFEWVQAQDLHRTFSPLLCGLLVSLFSFMIVYMDSSIPGVSPPSPFTPRSKRMYQQRARGVHLSYVIALAAGVVVSALMYADF